MRLIGKPDEVLNELLAAVVGRMRLAGRGPGAAR
jgi:hypothetical protein